MRWYEPSWKNFNHSYLVLFNEGPFLMEKKEVAGTVLQDVYSHKDKDIRNHEGGHHYFGFLSDYIGELPVDKVVTFPGAHVEGGRGSMEYGDVYATEPYGFSYSAMGKIYTSGAGAGIGGGGKKLDEPRSGVLKGGRTMNTTIYIPSILQCENGSVI